MNMNDDYLWDRTGEPDPEIQELEQVLGTLRYEAPPLEIPAGVEPGKRTVSFPRMSPAWAVAAAIALIVMGLGIWLGMQRRDTPDRTHSITTPSPISNTDQATVKAPEAVQQMKDSTSAIATNGTGPKATPLRHPQTTRAGSNRRRNLAVGNPALAGNELREAEASKAQLMLALRVASSKLNLALKKAQAPNQGNQSQNQHRVG